MPLTGYDTKNKLYKDGKVVSGMYKIADNNDGTCNISNDRSLENSTLYIDGEAYTGPVETLRVYGKMFVYDDKGNEKFSCLFNTNKSYITNNRHTYYFKDGKIADNVYIKVDGKDKYFINGELANNTYVKVDGKDKMFVNGEIANNTYVKVDGKDKYFVNGEIANNICVEVDGKQIPFVNGEICNVFCMINNKFFNKGELYSGEVQLDREVHVDYVVSNRGRLSATYESIVNVSDKYTIVNSDGTKEEICNNYTSSKGLPNCSEKKMYVNGELANNTYVKVDGKDKYFINGKLADNTYVEVNGKQKMFVNGELADNTYVEVEGKQKMFVNGELANNTYVNVDSKDKYFINGELANNVCVEIDGKQKMFVDGELANNVYIETENGLQMFVDGEVAHKVYVEIDGKQKMFVNGNIADGIYFDIDGKEELMFKDGELANGYVNVSPTIGERMYVNGEIADNGVQINGVNYWNGIACDPSGNPITTGSTTGGTTTGEATTEGVTGVTTTGSATGTTGTTGIPDTDNIGGRHLIDSMDDIDDISTDDIGPIEWTHSIDIGSLALSAAASGSEISSTSENSILSSIKDSLKLLRFKYQFYPAQMKRNDFTNVDGFDINPLNYFNKICDDIDVNDKIYFDGETLTVTGTTDGVKKLAEIKFDDNMRVTSASITKESNAREEFYYIKFEYDSNGMISSCDYSREDLYHYDNGEQYYGTTRNKAEYKNCVLQSLICDKQSTYDKSYGVSHEDESHVKIDGDLNILESEGKKYDNYSNDFGTYTETYKYDNGEVHRKTRIEYNWDDTIIKDFYVYKVPTTLYSNTDGTTSNLEYHEWNQKLYYNDGTLHQTESGYEDVTLRDYHIKYVDYDDEGKWHDTTEKSSGMATYTYKDYLDNIRVSEYESPYSFSEMKDIATFDTTKLTQNLEVEPIPERTGLKFPAAMSQAERNQEAADILKHICVLYGGTIGENYSWKMTYLGITYEFEYGFDKNGNFNVFSPKNIGVGELLSLRRKELENDVNSKNTDNNVGTFVQNAFGDCSILAAISTLESTEGYVEKTKTGWTVHFPGDLITQSTITLNFDVAEHGPIDVKLSFDEVYSMVGNNYTATGDLDTLILELAINKKLKEYNICDGAGWNVEAYNLLHKTNKVAVPLYNLYVFYATYADRDSWMPTKLFTILQLIESNILGSTSQDLSSLETKLNVLDLYLPYLNNTVTGTTSKGGIAIDDTTKQKYSMILPTEDKGDSTLIKWKNPNEDEYTQLNLLHAYKIVGYDKDYITVVNPHYPNTNIKVPKEIFVGVMTIQADTEKV